MTEAQASTLISTLKVIALIAALGVSMMFGNFGIVGWLFGV